MAELRGGAPLRRDGFDGRRRPARARRASACSRSPSTITSATGSSSRRRARIAARLGAERHIVLPLDLTGFGGSALTADIDVPKGGVERGRDPGHLRPGAQHHLPLALPRLGRGGGRARPVHRRQRARLFGLSRLPARIHRARSRRWPTSPPRPGVEGGRFTVHTPLIAMTKADIVREAARLGLDAGMSWSCYDPGAGRPPLRPVRFLPAARQGLRRGGPRRSHRSTRPRP